MAQQINLYTPILLQPERIFSARTMSWSLALLSGLLLLFCAGVLVLTQYRQREFQQIETGQRTEREQLTQALQAARLRSDPAVLEQQLRGLQKELTELRRRQAAQAHSQLAPGAHHSDMLALVARTLPEAAWITGMRLAPDSLDLEGMTLDPAALQIWIGRLEASPVLRGQHFTSVLVQQASAPGLGTLGAGAGTLGTASATPRPGRGAAPMWQFRLSGGAATAAGGPDHSQTSETRP